MKHQLAPWGKLGRGIFPTAYHPVLCHLLDVGFCFLSLWNNALTSGSRNRLADFLGLTTDRAGRWLSYLVALHDIGKVHPWFQSKGNGSRVFLAARGFPFTSTILDDTPHATVSKFWIVDHLPRTFSVSRSVTRRLAYTIGGHHGLFPQPNKKLKPFHADLWEDCRQAIAARLRDAFEIETAWEIKVDDNSLDQSFYILLAGLTSVADWLGSNSQFFPWAGNATILDDNPADFIATYIAKSSQQATEAIQMAGWRTRPSNQPSSIHWNSLFPGMTPRPLQATAIELASLNQLPRLVIAEAPMGEGKTEFAFYLARELSRLEDRAGTFVALPTQATTNAMLTRFERFLAQSQSGRQNLQLIHGRSLINEHFQKLKYRAEIFDEDSQGSQIVAEAWFASDKRQAILSPFGIGTVDQALLAALQVRHWFVRMFGLSNKVVIFDEVHAYDTYMSTILDHLLRWLGAIGTNVILLSATLPASRRTQLVQAFAGRSVGVPSAVYPRVTCYDTRSVQSVEIVDTSDSPKRRQRRIAVSQLREDCLDSFLKSKLIGSTCAAVICNTVGRAQCIWKRLSQSLPEADVRLFHARFAFDDRARIEHDVVAAFGRDRQVTRPTILVATQVIEQSLDLDFDVMISDWAPIDLILQRTGRLWRHERPNRAPHLTEPQLILLSPDLRDDGIPLFGPSEWVYHRHLLLRTFIALRNKSGIDIPAEIDPLVQVVYGDGLLIPDSFTVACEEARSDFESKRDTQQSNARSSLVPPPAQIDDVVGEAQLPLSEDDDPTIHQTLRATTRDSQPTLTVVLTYKINGRLFLDKEGTFPIDVETNSPPSWTEIRRTLGRSLSIANQTLIHELLSTDPPKSWAKSGMLRWCRPLELDEHGRCHLRSAYCQYDPVSGLSISNEPLDEGMDR